MKLFRILLVSVIGILSCGSHLIADTFGSGDDSFKIEFVTIGSPGNPADTTGDPNPAGSVSYSYRIGKYEISEQMIDKANTLGNLGITKDTRGPDKPATSVSWFEAAQFVNWLNESTGHTPAYKFDTNGEFQLWQPEDVGYDANNLFRNSEAKYFLPNTDEWYKAAFYDPETEMWFDFPNSSNTAPLPVASSTDPGTAVWNQGTGPADIMLAGGPSPFGTVAQAGNVWEWEETEYDLLNDDPDAIRALRGSDDGLTITDLGLSSSFRNQSLPWRSLGDVGFRIAAVIPEPCSLFLASSMALFVLFRRARKGDRYRFDVNYLITTSLPTPTSVNQSYATLK
jgi:hypothetical protein